jgi:hypothetical protein
MVNYRDGLEVCSIDPKIYIKRKKKLGEKANKNNESQLMAYGEKIVSHD